jgi:RimJ/RimL family protein N-acetyltransferase
MRVTGAYGKCLTREQAREGITKRQETETPSALCAIRVEGDIIGWAGVFLQDSRARVAEVAYYVLPDHWGNGYASEATRLLVTFAFEELNARQVQASVQADNPGSRHVLEKLDFQQEGTKREAYYKDGEYKDTALWSLLGNGICRII